MYYIGEKRTEVKLKIPWNQVIYQDCLNEENGIPTLEDKSIDLCLTDPCYNLGFMGKEGFKDRKGKIYYKDDFSSSEYWEFNKKWFKEVMRACKGLIFTPGTMNLYDWIIFQKPDYQLRIWYKKNAIGYFHVDPILMYGKIERWNSLRDVIDIPINLKKEVKTIHPCPKAFTVFYYILSQIKPESVLDPFIGSGTTAQACKALKIKWIGYEKMKYYEKDINKRLRNWEPIPKLIQKKLKGT